MTKKARVLVTGGGGRLGRYVVDRLKRSNSVTVIDTADPNISGVNFRKVDVLDLEAMTDALQGVEALVHLAAIPNPRTSSPQICFDVNVRGTWTALEAAKASGVRRAVIAGSDSATGLHFNPEGWPPQFLPVDESHPLRPSEVYSLTKEIVEAIARAAAVTGDIEVKVLRPAHVVFPPEYPDLKARGADVNNYHLWNFVAPEDVAQAFELALTCEDGNFASYFIAALDGLNARPTLELFEERFGFRPEVRNPELYERIPNAGVFDISHAQKALGFKPQINREELLRIAAAHLADT